MTTKFPTATTVTVNIDTAVDALLAVQKKRLTVTDVASYGWALGLSAPELIQALADKTKNGE